MTKCCHSVTGFFPDSKENIVEKRENSGNQPFFLFPPCFQMLHSSDWLELRTVMSNSEMTLISTYNIGLCEYSYLALHHTFVTFNDV